MSDTSDSGLNTNTENDQRTLVFVAGQDLLLVTGLVGLLAERGFNVRVRIEVTQRDQHTIRVDSSQVISVVIIGKNEDVGVSGAQVRPNTPVLLVVVRPLTAAEMAFALLTNVVGVVNAHDGVDGIVSALNMATSGFAMWTIDQLLAATQHLQEKDEGLPNVELTRREHEVLRLLHQGASIRSLALSLNISPKTVESLQRGLYRKLGVRSKIHAIEVGLTRDLLP